MNQLALVPLDPHADERARRHLSRAPGRHGLRSADLLAVLQFAEQVVTATEASAVSAMLGRLATLIGADASTLTRLNMATGFEEAVLWPAARAESPLLQRYPEVSRTHPLRPPLAALARAGGRRPTPVRISDVLTRRQWRATALHASSHREIDDQMSTLIAAQRHTIAVVAVNRHRGSFTDRQVALLDAAGVHLAAAVQRIGPQLVPAVQLAPTVRQVLAPVAIPPPKADATRSLSAATGSVGRPTARQREILVLVADGLTDAQIGRRLGLTAATVSKHLTRSYARLGVPNRAAAARLIASLDPLPRTG